MEMKKGKKLPLLAMAGATAYGLRAYAGYEGKDGSEPGVKGLLWSTLGVNSAGKWDSKRFVMLVTPVAIGAVGSLLASKSGVNKMISAIPFVKM
jgi:hypothetical protein